MYDNRRLPVLVSVVVYFGVSDQQLIRVLIVASTIHHLIRQILSVSPLSVLRFCSFPLSILQPHGFR